MKQVESPLSGWCMTNFHDGCKFLFVLGEKERKCPCSCHDTPESKGT
jgi:hypothetical protein